MAAPDAGGNASPRLTHLHRTAMNQNNTASRYGSLLIGLHWLMLLLIAAVYASIELREAYPRGSAIREGLKTLHYTLGLAIFVLVWLRLYARLRGPSPAIVPPPPRWQLATAHVTELAMYLLMVAMPLLGWLSLSAAGDPVSLFGWPLPRLIGADAQRAHLLEEVHETIGTVGYALIGAHALAALVHHYIRRDNTLSRMLSGK
jgi:cytochrome b561